MSGDRHELVRRSNVERVFRAIGDHAPVSRADLVRLTGLSKPTVLTLVAAMEHEGLIRYAPRNGSLTRSAGRIPMAYEPNPQAAYVVGIDVGGTKTAARVADLAGVVRAEVEEATTRRGGEAVVRQIVEVARRVAKDASVPWSRVDAVTVGTPGVENPNGTIRLADNVRGLDEVMVGGGLRRALRTSVRIENDVNLAALGELEQGVARSCRTFVLLAIGTGLGMGIVVDGRLARGARGAAGEVAYLPFGADPAGEDARRRGAFELAAAGSGVQAMLVDELARSRRSGATSLAPGNSARDVYSAAADGDALALRVVERHATVVAESVLAVASILDPELVVLGGGIGANPLLLDPLRRAVERITPWPVRIETSALGASAGVIGAVHHARRSLPEIESARVSARIQAGGIDA